MIELPNDRNVELHHLEDTSCPCVAVRIGRHVIFQDEGQHKDVLLSGPPCLCNSFFSLLKGLCHEMDLAFDDMYC
jgi:hypothetical protein